MTVSTAPESEPQVWTAAANGLFYRDDLELPSFPAPARQDERDCVNLPLIVLKAMHVLKQFMNTVKDASLPSKLDSTFEKLTELEQKIYWRPKDLPARYIGLDNPVHVFTEDRNAKWINCLSLTRPSIPMEDDGLGPQDSVSNRDSDSEDTDFCEDEDERSAEQVFSGALW